MHLKSVSISKILFGAAPCSNILAQHPGTIAVGSIDMFDRRSVGDFGAFDFGNTSCIDIWAPGGGLGSSMVGAAGGRIPRSYWSLELQPWLSLCFM